MDLSLQFFGRLLMVLVMTGAMGINPPQLAQTAQNSEPVIIVFHPDIDVNEAAPVLTQAYGLQPGFIYQHALKGMSAMVSAGRLGALERDRRVAYVLPDRVHVLDVPLNTVQDATEQMIPTGIWRVFADTNPNLGIDGLDDQRVDVDVAVIDTGVDFQHPDLNVVGGVNCSGGWPYKTSCTPGGDDDYFHGTHVAGTIAALDNDFGVVGVAPGARIWSVKVCSGSRPLCFDSWIIAGIDWVAGQADIIEVANMSLGGSVFNQAEYDAVMGAVNLGVAFAVSAGNAAADAGDFYPAAYDNVITVSALADFDGLPGALGNPTCTADQDDTLADFSNWGAAVEIAAPGVCIYSTIPLEMGAGYGTASGTSMASPHVAGALALLASLNKPNSAADVYDLYNQVIQSGNFDWWDDSGDGILEPLLDLSNFNARQTSPIHFPTVNIVSPAEGDHFQSGFFITFMGSAWDDEGNDLTETLKWTSSLEGEIGAGGLFGVVLSDGVHTITATAYDKDRKQGSFSITITVGSANHMHRRLVKSK
jgi:subtilisin family serine protease